MKVLKENSNLRRNESILQELKVKCQLLGKIKKRKLTYFGHFYHPHGCDVLSKEGKETPTQRMDEL